MGKVIPKVFRINTGSCNGCDVEFVAAAFVEKYGVAALEPELVENVEDANLIVVTGPLTARSEPFMRAALSKVKKPFVVVGIGTCSISSGIFRDSYAINGPTDKFVEVHVNVAGCPPRPESVAEGIAKGAKVLEHLLKGEAIPNKIDTIFKDFSAPESFRGRVDLNADECTACRTCEIVCPSNAIKITKQGDKFIHEIWHNSCCYCGNCSFFCPTGAIFNTNSFDTAKLQNEKYTDVNRAEISYSTCKECGEKFKAPTDGLLSKAYNEKNIKKLDATLCPSCRKIENFKRIYA